MDMRGHTCTCLFQSCVDKVSLYTPKSAQRTEISVPLVNRFFLERLKCCKSALQFYKESDLPHFVKSSLKH